MLGFERIGGFVLDGVFHDEGHGEHGDTAGGENAVNLPQGSHIVIDMLKEMGGVHKIERGGVVGQGPQIHMIVHARHHSIGGSVR